MLKNSRPTIEPWVLQKVFLAICYIRYQSLRVVSSLLDNYKKVFLAICHIQYQSLRVVSSLLDNYKLALVSLSQRHKHEI